MNTQRRGGIKTHSLLALLLVTCKLFLTGEPQPKIKIVTSIYPFADFAQKVSGERGQVRILMPPGAEAHTWKPRPSDIFELNEANLFIGVGSSLEPWLEGILASIDNPKLRILEADQIVETLEHEVKGQAHDHSDEIRDPHLWLDPINDIRIVEEIRDILTDLEPPNTALFSKNAAAYIEHLKNLDRLYRETLQTCSSRTLIMGGHAAFGYLAERYGLVQITVFGSSPDAQPSPKQVVEIIGFAREKGVKAVFYENAVSPDIARTLAKEIGAMILPLNPAVSLTRSEMKAGVDFIEVMKKNLENLRIGLGCQ